MFKSYFYLNRYILELFPLVNNHRITSCFSQEKDKIILCIKDTSEKYLEFSVNPGMPFITIKEKYTRAKKNTVDFFPEIIDAQIKNVLISDNDRIILINTDRGNLYFAIRGKFTNVFFIKDERVLSFKNEDEEYLQKIKSEFESSVYLNEFNQLDLTKISDKNIEEIRKIFPIVGKEIANEVVARNSKVNDAEALMDVLKIFKDGETVIYENEKTGELKIGFAGLLLFKEFNRTVYDNLIFAFNIYLSKIYQKEEFNRKYKLVSSYLEKELNALTNKLTKLKAVIDKGSREDELNKIANLILINLNKIKPGDKIIELEDVYGDGKIIKIELDPKLLPNQNAEKYFNKAKSDKINLSKSKEIYSDTEKKFNQFLKYKTRLSINISISELEQIMKELKIKDKELTKPDDDLKDKFKHYLIDNKFHVYVGKDSTNNDLLTTKFAKQNDYWFHARSVSGSHVVLRVENTKEPIPKNVLKKAASLAAYHSKAKTAGLSPVSFTLKKYVVKRKGMPVGQVALLKEDVLLVKPEIPSNCEYITVD